MPCCSGVTSNPLELGVLGIGVSSFFVSFLYVSIFCSPCSSSTATTRSSLAASALLALASASPFFSFTLCSHAVRNCDVAGRAVSAFSTISKLYNALAFFLALAASALLASDSACRRCSIIIFSARCFRAACCVSKIRCVSASSSSISWRSSTKVSSIASS